MPDPDYSAWLITQLVMAVFHHYDCAGLDESTARIAESLWGFCWPRSEAKSRNKADSASPKPRRSSK